MAAAISEVRREPPFRLRDVILKGCSNGASALTWVFLTVFGAAMEVRQETDNYLECGSSAVGAEASGAARYSDDCWAVRPYHRAYRVIHMVGGSLGIMHVCFHLVSWTSKRLSKTNSLLFLLRDHVRMCSWLALSWSVAYAYQHLTYSTLFCAHGGGDFCEKRPDGYNVIRGVYMSLLVIASTTFATYAVVMACFAWQFWTKRQKVWESITRVEDALTVTPRLQEAFEVDRTLRRTNHIQHFVDQWGKRTDQDIMELLPDRTSALTRALVNDIRASSSSSGSGSGSGPFDTPAPADGGGKVDVVRREDFMEYLGKNGVVTREEREALWDILSQTRRRRITREQGAERAKGVPTPPPSSCASEQNAVDEADVEEEEEEEEEEEKKGSGAARPIAGSRKSGAADSESSTTPSEGGGCCSHVDSVDIEDLLYELYFDRKQFANAVRTDRLVIDFLLRYALATLLPACLIITSKIFGYDDAFGRGVDLFKTYSVIVSYVYTNMSSQVRFVTLMLIERPFNMGDIISFENEAYEVEYFTSSHTMLSGPSACVVPNTSLIDGSIVNLTRESVSQHLDIGLPFIATYTPEDMARAINKYMAANPRDVHSVRVGWVGTDGRTKTLRCNWRYKFRVFDRSRLNLARTRVLNALLQHCDAELVRSALLEALGGGGGINDVQGPTGRAQAVWDRNDLVAKRNKKRD